VVDSALTLPEALGKNDFPPRVLKDQRLVTVRYYGFDGKLHQGQLVVHRDLEGEVREIFEEIRKSRFPLAKVVPIVRYGWSDDRSVADNNTSGFNYRRVEGTRVLSRHATGRAIDLNPLQNPYVGHSSEPYRPEVRGTFTRESPVVKAFLRRGWKWGGLWKRKDYQHFEKPVAR
jgi:hypothetical protein